ncbi:chemotaxis protein CheB [Sunxiuqinia sp. A32]|uniref:chemotaxis protein CheB n=1 Tax=Sunxiuqinia sp. A32 TaxID=3461496 RepID=UPI0040463B6A
MYKAIVIGTSFGGLDALKAILPKFMKNFPIPVIVVLHIGEHNNEIFIRQLNEISELTIKEAESGELITAGHVYFAPPNYHLLVEDDYTFSLSTDEKLNFSRPSIDILFESAAWAYRDGLIGVILTGANSDGANGMKMIKSFGGMTVIENPCHAVSPVMPRFALKIAKPEIKLNLDKIADKLIELAYLK